MNYGCSARRIGALALIVASLGVVSAFGTSGAAASPSAAAGAASGPLPARTEAKVRQIVRRFRDVNRTPGVLVGIWSPRGKFVSAKGVANLATGRRLNTRKQFKIGSQTKAFIAVLVLQLVGEKKVSLDDHISKRVAGVPNGDQVTIRQLLNHTSGLGNPFPTEQVLGRVRCTPADLLALGASAPPVAPPGTKWAYSTTCSGGSWSSRPARR